MKLTTRFLFSLGIFTGSALLALSCGDSQKSDESGGIVEAGSTGSPQGGTTQGGTSGAGAEGNESGDGGSDRGGSGQGGNAGAGGEGGSDDGGSGSGAGGEGADPGTGGSAGAMAGAGMGGMAGAGMAGGAGTLGGAGTGGASGAGGMAGTGIAGSAGAGAGAGGMSGQGGASGAAGSGGIAGSGGGAGSGGAGGSSGNGGMAGTGGGPPPGCFRIDPLSWVRTRYPDYTPYPWGMQDGAAALTVARYNWVGWFEYDISFPSTGNFRITVRTADDGWHEGLIDELYNHFSVGVAGTTRLDFDANVSPYDDGAFAVGNLSFHDATGPVFAATAGPKVVRFDNIADRWVDGDDIQMHIAYIQICSVP